MWYHGKALHIKVLIKVLKVGASGDTPSFHFAIFDEYIEWAI